MIDYSLNITGSEWIIIIFVALVLILGTGRLPGAARKLGRAVNEYNKAKNDVQNHMRDFSKENLQISGPVQSERQKLEDIARSLGVDVVGKSDEELRRIITEKIGQKRVDEPDKTS